MDRIFEDHAYHLTGAASLVNHKHKNPNSYEIIQILSGEGSAFLQDRTYPLCAGMLLLIDAASLHCILPSDVSTYCRNKLIVDKQYLHKLFAAMQSEKMLLSFFQPHAGSCFYLKETDAEQVDRLFASMESEFARDLPDGQVPVCSSLLSIFVLCSRFTQQVMPRTDDKLAPVMQYVRMHYQEELTVENIAEQMHMSKFYLCHMFRKQTGLTVMQYLYEQRLAAAKRLLQASSESISDIAYSCGFGSSSHFCTWFRKKEGMSPREYRKRHYLTKV